MKQLLKLSIVPMIFVLACQQQETKMESTNPILSEWDTPFGVPPLDKIKDEHYKPAFEAAMAEHKEEIAAITGVF